MEIEVYEKINDLPGILELGRCISGSRMFGCDNQEQGVVLALQCMAERKPPLELAKNYHIINGKLSKRADAMLADFRKAGGSFVFADLKNTEEQKAKVQFEGETYDVSYSIDDAKRAHLLPAKPGSGWNKYPAAMLRARLVSETLRAIAPELVQGAYTPEEISDFDSTPQRKPVKAAEGVFIPVETIPEKQPAQDTPAQNTSSKDRTPYLLGKIKEAWQALKKTDADIVKACKFAGADVAEFAELDQPQMEKLLKELQRQMNVLAATNSSAPAPKQPAKKVAKKGKPNFDPIPSKGSKGDDYLPMAHASDLEKALPKGSEDQVNAYLVKLHWIKQGQTFRDLDPQQIEKIMNKFDNFLRVAGVTRAV